MRLGLPVKRVAEALHFPLLKEIESVKERAVIVKTMIIIALSCICEIKGAREEL